MPTTPANVTSVRLLILNEIVAKFANMDPNLPPGDPYGLSWGTAELGPLADFDNKKRYSIGVVPGAERETFQIPFVMCFLAVNVEFRITINRFDERPGIMAEQALTVVKRALTEDRHWGGKAIDTKIAGSEIDMMTYADRSVMGVCNAVVQYRYNYNDVRKAGPNS
jgi:hypothetical protein